MGRTLRFEEIALRIQPVGGRGRCLVQITQSAYGAQASCEADFSSLLYDERLYRALEVGLSGNGTQGESNRNLSNTTADFRAASPEAVGEQLFRTVFSGPVLETFLLSLGRVEANPETGLRIRLQIDLTLPEASEISALPWELLYRADKRDFLARNPLTPVVRYLEVSRLTTPAPLASTLRILIVRSRPSDLGALDLKGEQDVITSAWEWGRNEVAVEFLDQPTLFALKRKLLSEAFHVLHFMGHGDFDCETSEGTLIFEDSLGKSSPVTGRLLAEMLKGSRCLRLVVLNACETARLPRRRGKDPFSGVASALVQAGLPAVVAMQLPISDQAALVFSRDFYTALAAGFPVDAAAAEARRGVYVAFEHSWEWATPAVFMNMPDGRLLLVQEPEGANPGPGLLVDHVEPGKLLTLSELDGLELIQKRELLALYESRLKESAETPEVHFVIGLIHLDLRDYERALSFLQRSTEKGGREPGTFFYEALARLGGRQPRTLTFEQIKSVEFALRAAQVADGDTPEVLLLSAIIKHDYYRSHRLRIAPPPIEDLLAAVRRCRLAREHVRLLSKHLSVPPAIRDFLMDPAG